MWSAADGEHKDGTHRLWQGREKVCSKMVSTKKGIKKTKNKLKRKNRKKKKKIKK